ncbi:hypothetical protein MMC17_006677 [Xylographa soralifera]|nr:hypothetical protein [Xylographa soralifera]
MIPYEYRPRAQNQICLLEVDATQADLACQIHTVELDNVPSYVALSYAWDGQSMTLPIRCKKSYLKIAADVFDFLVYWKVRGDGRLLWIDAVSMDQNDTVEKRIRVQMMGQIYTSAELVIVSLGAYN